MWATLNQDVKEESEVPVLREEEEEKEASSLEFNHKKNLRYILTGEQNPPKKFLFSAFSRTKRETEESKTWRI